jgi:hypothetical protein
MKLIGGVGECGIFWLRTWPILTKKLLKDSAI